jgi:hypothetical protein
MICCYLYIQSSSQNWFSLLLIIHRLLDNKIIYPGIFRKITQKSFPYLISNNYNNCKKIDSKNWKRKHEKVFIKSHYEGCTFVPVTVTKQQLIRCLSIDTPKLICLTFLVSDLWKIKLMMKLVRKLAQARVSFNFKAWLYPPPPRWIYQY